MIDKIKSLKHKLENTISTISKISPLEVLKRGFSAVEKNGKRVSSIKQVDRDDLIKLRFADGSAVAVINSVSEEK